MVSRENVSSSTPIGANQMVLSVSEKGPVDRIPDWEIGETVTLTIDVYKRQEYNVAASRCLRCGQAVAG